MKTTRAKGKTYEKQAKGFVDVVPKPSQADYEPSSRPQKRRLKRNRI